MAATVNDLDLGFSLEEINQIVNKKVDGPTHAERLRRLRKALFHPASRWADLPLGVKRDLAQQISARLDGYWPGKAKKPTATPSAEQGEQIDLGLFGSAQRLPRRPYCADDLAAGLRIRSLAQALTKPYLQVNPPHLRVWSIYDVDRAGAVLAWEDAGLPPPAWSAVNRENGHAHLVWGLTAPVLVDSPDMRQAPLRYLCAVESAFREKLQADNGYSGLITKNPAHPLWRVLKGPQQGYELGYLAEWVDLPKHTPKRKPEEVGLGRNVTLFDWLRQYAYRHIRRYKAEGERNIILWQAHLYAKALGRNGDFTYPLSGSEVWHIVKSVAKWTWRRFDLAASDAKFSALQAHRGRKGGLAATNQAEAGKVSGMARAQASEDKRASARLMRAKGMTYEQIAEELGVSTMTAWRLCNE